MDNFHKKEYEDGININDKKFNFKFKKRILLFLIKIKIGNILMNF